jgi:hypothetical protein
MELKVINFLSLNSITTDQSKDTGMALVFISLVLSYFFSFELYLLGLCLLLLNMVWPSAFKPAAIVWFGISHILGAIMPRVVLSVIFFVIVTPIGLVRRLLNKDTLLLKSWQAGKGSVFIVRDHLYQMDDINSPY